MEVTPIDRKSMATIASLTSVAVLAGATPAYGSGNTTERALRHQIAVLTKQKKALTVSENR